MVIKGITRRVLRETNVDKSGNMYDMKKYLKTQDISTYNTYT